MTKIMNFLLDIPLLPRRWRKAHSDALFGTTHMPEDSLNCKLHALLKLEAIL